MNFELPNNCNKRKLCFKTIAVVVVVKLVVLCIHINKRYGWVEFSSQLAVLIWATVCKWRNNNTTTIISFALNVRSIHFSTPTITIITHTYVQYTPKCSRFKSSLKLCVKTIKHSKYIAKLFFALRLREDFSWDVFLYLYCLLFTLWANLWKL